MDVTLFDFTLPKDRIALRPAVPRDSARLLVVRPDGLEDKVLLDLPTCLLPGDCIVSNDTRVIPARLFGHRGEAHVEITLHKRIDDTQWKAFARPAKKCRPGDVIDFDGLKASVRARDGGEVTLQFDSNDLDRDLGAHGVMPLPPYIAALRPVDNQDRADYQTIFSCRPGAVAAPTAGLHFTDRVLQDLKMRGIGFETLTLHVGAGTFLPVKVDDTDDHKMHAEWGEISKETADRLNAVRAAGGRIVAIGTTSLRLLESAADERGILHPFRGDTDIFMTPGYRFRAVDVLLTNFHLPKSTLFMLVSAFCGLERMQRAYAHAIENKYRFYSYGDASLLFPAPADENL